MNDDRNMCLRALVQSLIDIALQAIWIVRAGREGVKDFFEKAGFELWGITMEKPRLVGRC